MRPSQIPDIELACTEPSRCIEMSSESAASEGRLRPVYALWQRHGKQAQPTKYFQMKTLNTIFMFFILLFIFVSCGNWGWESIDTDNEEQLNIFGLISLDDSLESFILVHKTLDTAGPTDSITGYDTTYYEAWEWYNEDTGVTERDTFWYDPPYIRSLTESLYLVKDATVTVSDADRSYSFTRNPTDTDRGDEYEYYGYDDVFSDPAVYTNVDGSFNPQPDTEYILTITTPGGHHLTGSTVTPALPRIKEDALEDTLSIKGLYEVRWDYVGDYNTLIVTGLIPNSWGEYICASDQRRYLEPGDTTWNSEYYSWCLGSNDNPDAVALMDIRLRYLDENYYRYFAGINEGSEGISNFLIGEGSIGTAFGVEGGFGVFGALSSYWTRRYATP